MYLFIYTYLCIYVVNDDHTHTHTHLGCLILTTSGLKRSCGSFSSCNPCRWMLRSCKCWRIQENILGGSMEERKKIRGTQRPVFCWEVGKNPWVPKKNCGSTPTWFLFLSFDRHHVFFSQVRELYITLPICIESGSTMCSCQRNPPNLWCPNYMARGGARFLVPFHVCSNHLT